MGRPGWEDDKVQMLVQLWPEKSPRVIAEAVGKSRNAVIGMAHRLGLSKKAPGRNPAGPRKKRAPYVRKGPQAATPPIYGPLEPIPLIEASAFQCKAIIDNQYDENGLAMVCGKPTVEGNAFSFCSEHLKRFTTQSNRGFANVRIEPINQQLQSDKE